MSKLSYYCLLVFVISLSLTSCLKNDNDWYNNNTDPVTPGGGGDAPGGGGGSGVSADLGELTSFDVSFNDAALSETETVSADDDDYVENSTFNNTIKIAYNGSSVTISGDNDGCVTAVGANVVVNAAKANVYELSGSTTDGRFKIYSDKKFQIKLNGVSITNPTGAAINVQSKKRAFLTIADGTENVLTDGSEYVAKDSLEGTEKQKGTYYSKGQTIINGSGKLTINANYKHGIDTKDYLRIRKNTNIRINATAGNCIKSEDDDTAEGIGIQMEGGVLNLNCSSTAGKGLSSDGNITINGGRITVICTGDGEWDGDDAEELDVSGAAGIKADGALKINAGELWLKSTGKGGKAINGDSLIQVNGGKIRAITTGQAYTYTYQGTTYDTNPKGIKTDQTIEITGGDVMVRSTGTSDGSEGIESKEQLIVSGGDVKVYAADDAMNCGYGSESARKKGKTANAGKIIIKGGTILCYSTNNDAIDSNGTITVSGGTIYAFGTTSPEGGMDCDQNTFTITGGTIMSFGGDSSTPSSSASTQCSVLLRSQSLSSGTTYKITDSSSNILASVEMPRSYSGAVVLLTSPSFVKGSSYQFGNTSFTLSSIVNTSGSGGNTPGGGGGMPGR